MEYARVKLFQIVKNVLQAQKFAQNVQQCLSCYKQALSLTDIDKEQAFLLNNMANVILHHRESSLYQEAKAYSNKALAIPLKQDFPYPKYNLLMLDILENTPETIRLEIKTWLQSLKVNPKTCVKNVLPKLNDSDAMEQEKKQLLGDILQ